MNYPYHTTKIVTNRRYPTYQLHAKTTNESLPPMTVMGVCVLETMSWLRGRLSQYDSLPGEVCLPEPCDYEQFDIQELKSFHLNLGFSLDVVYSEKNKLWTFCLIEDDMGANIGTPDERKPVVGRNFETNIAFRVIENAVEVGFQTICSEPIDTTAVCEVFRPSVVKALYKNKNVGLRHILNITDTPLEIGTAKEFRRIHDAVSNPLRELPVVIFTQPQAVRKATEIPGIDLSFLTNQVPKSTPQYDKADYSTHLKIDHEALGIKLNLPARPKKETPAPEPAENIHETKPEIVVPDTVDADRIAKSAASFAFVCSASDEMFENVRTAFCSDLEKGDILIIYKDSACEVFRFSEFSDKLDETRRAIRSVLTIYPKRRSIDWGNVVFTSDARIMEYQDRLSDKLTAEEENAVLKAELSELQKKLKEAEDTNRDINANAENNRRLIKENSNLQSELDSKNKEYDKLNDEYHLMRSAKERLTPTIDFYRQKAREAAHYPHDKEMIPDWAAEFSETLLIHKNAAASLKKYPRAVNMDVLCDGLYFLHGYGLYRQGKITAEELDLYAEEYGWEVQGCGKEALKMFHSEYSVPMDNGSKELSLHIKYGVNPQHWVRIYFYYDEDLRRVVVGYMPDHLPTISDKT